MAAVPVFEQAETIAREASVAEVATLLQEVLTSRLTAYIVGATSGRIVGAWASGQVSQIDRAQDERLRTAFEVTQLLVTADSPKVVRAWFSGANPQLDDVSPAEAIREGRSADVLDAARAFIVGG